MNATLEKFGYPSSLIKKYKHWALLLRPAQVTLGSCVIVTTGDETRRKDMPKGAGAEFFDIQIALEDALKGAFGCTLTNDHTLRLVDPHMHSHILPRYPAVKTFAGEGFVDPSLMKAPLDLTQKVPERSEKVMAAIKAAIKANLA